MKRSDVVKLVIGTAAVGVVAYSVMRPPCDPNTGAQCNSSSGGGHGFFSGGSGGEANAGAARGGFGGHGGGAGE